MNKSIRKDEDNMFVSRIPNLSVPYNASQYRQYLLPSKEVYDSIIERNLDTKDIKPIAITSNRLSTRMQHQKGNFVAYSVYNTDNMDDIDLIHIQNEIYQNAKEKKSFKPFVLKIIIPKDIKKQVAEWCKIMGVSCAEMYPELFNIGTDISSRIFP